MRIDLMDLFEDKFQDIHEDLWQYLSRTEKPIVLYGMGDGADKILNILEEVDLISTKDFNKNYAIVIFEFIKAVITSKIFILLFILLMAFAIFYILCVIRYNIRHKNKNKVVDISKAKKK